MGEIELLRSAAAAKRGRALLEQRERRRVQLRARGRQRAWRERTVGSHKMKVRTGGSNHSRT